MVPNQGKRDTGIIVRAPQGLTVCVTIKAYTRLIGFGITLAWSNNADHVKGIYAPGSGVQVIGNVLYNIKAVNRQGIAIYHQGSYSNSIFRNNMIMDFGTGDFASWSQSSGFYLRDGVSNTKFYNNTIVNSSNGTYKAYGFTFRDLGAGNVVKNNYCGNNYGKSFYKYGGTAPEVTYCISGDATADDWGGAGNRINKSTTSQFKNATVGSEDLRLKRSADCINAGFDLSGEGFTDDIDGDPRGYGGAWDVGADEEHAEGTVFSFF